MEPTKALRQLGQSAAVAALVCSGAAPAVGLGEISVDSAINERFAASIPLLTPTPEQRESLSVHVANAEDFKRVGIEWTDYLSTLRFRLLDTPAGTRVVIDSDERVHEPFLTMIVEASWSGGRLQREYSVLFDPPKELGLPMMRQEHPAVLAASPPEAAATSRPLPAPAPQPAYPPRPQVSAAPVHAAARPPRPAAQSHRPSLAAPAPSVYGPVRVHEFPRGIAARLHRPAATTQEQVELALYRANPAAFAGGRLDRLIPGSMLKVPSPAQIQAEPAASARAIILDMRAQLNPVATPRPAAAAPAPVATRQAAPPVPAPRPAVDAPVAVAAPTPLAQPTPNTGVAAAPAPSTAPPPVAAVVPAPPSPPANLAPPRSGELGRRDWAVMLWIWSAAFLLMGLGALLLMLLRAWTRGRPARAAARHRPIATPLAAARYEQPLPAAAPATTEIAPAAPAVVAATASVEAPPSETVAESLPEEAVTAAISEAELCQLYGHFKESARILAETAAKAPANKQLRFKLAEAYLAAGMRESFEKVAAELRGQLDAAMVQRLDQLAA